MKVKLFIVIALALAAVLPAPATKLRLVYGAKWQRAGVDVRKTLESQAWKSLAKSQYKVEFVDEDGHKPSALNRDTKGRAISWKLPCIFLLDDRDRCFCVIENVPYNATPEWIFRQVNRVSTKRAEIEKAHGTDTIDGCGELMLAMEKYVGGPNRVIMEGFYRDVYEKLRRLDPTDKEGWLRHFTMPFTDHEGKDRTCNNSDGLEIVEEATWYRKEKKTYDGERFMQAQMALPAKHLTLEQKQALLMAKFALYAPEDMNHRWESDRRAEAITLLKRIAEASEHTLWGTAALGWLASPAIGEPALSTYWGWRKGDIPTGKFELTVKYGVTHSFSKQGNYSIDFRRTDGASITVESVTLYRGKTEVAKLTKTPFTVKIGRADAGRLTHMVLRGTAGGTSAGQIEIVRNVLKPRKEVK